MAATSVETLSSAFRTCARPIALSFAHTKHGNTPERLTDPFRLSFPVPTMTLSQIYRSMLIGRAVSSASSRACVEAF